MRVCYGRVGVTRNTGGFSLVELLVALGILALVAAVVAPQVLRYLGQARSQTAMAQLKNIESAIELFSLDTGAYPSKEDGIAALVKQPAAVSGWRGPYLKKESGLVDPWGAQFHYEVPGKKAAFDLYSLGKDGKEGGTGEDSDIVNW